MPEEFERKSSRTEDEAVREPARKSSAREEDAEVEGHLRINHGETNRRAGETERKA
jgi:hypothetical protein